MWIPAMDRKLQRRQRPGGLPPGLINNPGLGLRQGNPNVASPPATPVTAAQDGLRLVNVDQGGSQPAAEQPAATTPAEATAGSVEAQTISATAASAGAFTAEVEEPPVATTLDVAPVNNAEEPDETQTPGTDEAPAATPDVTSIDAPSQAPLTTLVATSPVAASESNDIALPAITSSIELPSVVPDFRSNPGAADQETVFVSSSSAVLPSATQATNINPQAPEVTEASAAPAQFDADDRAGMAVGSVAGVAFLLTIVLFFYKWRKGTLSTTFTASRLLSGSRRASADMQESLVEKQTAPKALSIRSVTKRLRNNPLFMNPWNGPRKSWVSSRRGALTDGGDVPPIPPEYKGKPADAWSTRSSVTASSDGLDAGTISGSYRASGTFGGSRKSRFSFASAKTSNTSHSAKSTGSSAISSVVEILPPLPKLLSFWSKSSSSGSPRSSSAVSDASAAEEGTARSVKSSGENISASMISGPIMSDIGSLQSKRSSVGTFGSQAAAELPPPPPVHPLRAHTVRRLGDDETSNGGPWPLPS